MIKARRATADEEAERDRCDKRAGGLARPRCRGDRRGPHGDPFAVLGLHEVGKGWLPAASSRTPSLVPRYTLTGKHRRLAVAARRCRFLRRLLSPPERQPLRYHATQRRRRLVDDDPIASARCSARWTTTARRGHASRLYDKLGAHLIAHEGVDGRAFRRLGAECAPRLGGRRFQRLGRPPPPDAQARRQRHVGDLRARGRRRGPSTSTRSSAPMARCCR